MKIKRMWALLLGLCSVLIIVSLSVLTGCSSSTPSTQASPTPAASPTQAATTSVKPVILKLAPGQLPNAQALFGGIPQWVAEIEKRTQGRVKIEVYYGETLAKGREVIDALETGLADVIFPAPHHQPGKLPLFTIGNVPGITDDYWAKNQAFFELMMTEKPLIDEFAKYGGRIIGAASYPPTGLLSLSPIDSLEQIKGLKISAMYPSSELVAKFSAAPLSISPPEQYEAMLRKTVDGDAAPVAAVIDFKFYEVAKYFTTFNLGDRQHALVISEAAYSKLSPTDRKIIDDFAPEYTQMAYDAAAIGLEPRGSDILLDNGVKFIKPSASDASKLLQAADEMATAWVEEMDGKGLPGTALMKRYKELIRKYEAISPYKK